MRVAPVRCPMKRNWGRGVGLPHSNTTPEPGWTGQADADPPLDLQAPPGIRLWIPRRRAPEAAGATATPKGITWTGGGHRLQRLEPARIPATGRDFDASRSVPAVLLQQHPAAPVGDIISTRCALPTSTVSAACTSGRRGERQAHGLVTLEAGQARDCSGPDGGCSAPWGWSQESRWTWISPPRLQPGENPSVSGAASPVT